MKKNIITISTIVAILLITQLCMGCKPTTYTDERGNKYYLHGVCISSHTEPNYISTIDQNGNITQTYMGNKDVCDETRTNIIYINK